MRSRILDRNIQNPAIMMRVGHWVELARVIDGDDRGFRQIDEPAVDLRGLLKHPKGANAQYSFSYLDRGIVINREAAAGWLKAVCRGHKGDLLVKVRRLRLRWATGIRGFRSQKNGYQRLGSTD